MWGAVVWTFSVFPYRDGFFAAFQNLSAKSARVRSPEASTPHQTRPWAQPYSGMCQHWLAQDETLADPAPGARGPQPSASSERNWPLCKSLSRFS